MKQEVGTEMDGNGADVLILAIYRPKVLCYSLSPAQVVANPFLWLILTSDFFRLKRQRGHLDL